MTPIHSTIPVLLTLVSLGPDSIEAVACPSCHILMNLHQPETGFPERMLWTCEECGNWYLMDLVPESLEAVLVSLPDAGHFRHALGR